MPRVDLSRRRERARLRPADVGIAGTAQPSVGTPGVTRLVGMAGALVGTESPVLSRRPAISIDPALFRVLETRLEPDECPSAPVADENGCHAPAALRNRPAARPTVLAGQVLPAVRAGRVGHEVRGPAVRAALHPLATRGEWAFARGIFHFVPFPTKDREDRDEPDDGRADQDHDFGRLIHGHPPDGRSRPPRRDRTSWRQA
jgi:hypothetical protein